jgi:hypothetical protein
LIGYFNAKILALSSIQKSNHSSKIKASPSFRYIPDEKSGDAAAKRFMKQNLCYYAWLLIAKAQVL